MKKESRVYLRALELDDYKTSIKWRNDDSIWSQLGGVKYFVSEAYEKKWVEEAIFNPNVIRLAICLKENDLYIGNVYILDINLIDRKGNSHIFIGNKEYWGKGYATEAYMLLLEYAFCERGFHRIGAHVLEDNKASIALHKKCGFSCDGVFRKATFKNGRWQNQFVFSILEEEFFAMQKASAETAQDCIKPSYLHP